MYRLIKAEWYDHRYSLTLLILSTMLTTLLAHLWSLPTKMLGYVVVLQFYLMTGIMVYAYIKYSLAGHDRLRVLRPISLSQVGLARLLTFPIFWLGLVLTFGAFNEVCCGFDVPISLYETVSLFTAIILIINAFQFIFFDCQIKMAYLPVFFSYLVLLLIMVGVMALAWYIFLYFSHSIVPLLIGIILNGLSWRLFILRQDYRK